VAQATAGILALTLMVPSINLAGALWVSRDLQIVVIEICDQVIDCDLRHGLAKTSVCFEWLFAFLLVLVTDWRA